MPNTIILFGMDAVSVLDEISQDSNLLEVKSYEKEERKTSTVTPRFKGDRKRDQVTPVFMQILVNHEIQKLVCLTPDCLKNPQHPGVLEKLIRAVLYESEKVVLCPSSSRNPRDNPEQTYRDWEVFKKQVMELNKEGIKTKLPEDLVSRGQKPLEIIAPFYRRVASSSKITSYATFLKHCQIYTPVSLQNRIGTFSVQEQKKSEGKELNTETNLVMTR